MSHNATLDSATLVSHDLRSRLHIIVHGYAAEEVDPTRDSVTEMNFLRLTVRLTDPRGDVASLGCRALRTELSELAEALAFCGDAQQSRWRGRLLDCPLVLEVERPQDKTTLWTIGAVLVEGGVLPPGVELRWDEQRLDDPTGMMSGVQFEARPQALTVFARALEAAVERYPIRRRRRSA